MSSRDDLDGLLAQASAAERAGRPGDALGMLTVAVAELLAHGKRFQYPFEWMARLESSLGAHEAAEAAAVVGRTIAEEARYRPGVVRMEVLRAQLALQAQEPDRAEALLAELHSDDGGPLLGPVSVDRLEAIVGWLRALRFREHAALDLAPLRAELALVIAELWSERGAYRSALALLDAIEHDLVAAAPALRLDHVRLLQAELLIAAGRLHDAGVRLSALSPPPATSADRARVALVQVRAALAGGQLARAVAELDALAATPPGDPMLFAATAAARIAVDAELNLLETATKTADDALATLSATGAPSPAIELLERAKHDVAARGRSAITSWELPFTLDAVAAAPPPPPAVEVTGVRGRLTAAWTRAANRVLLALQSGDVCVAEAEQARLEDLARAIESDYIACRVALSGAIVAFYRRPGSTDQLLAIADRFHAMGCRLAEAQAVRFASWAAAQRHELDTYVALTRRASALVDAIAADLGAEQRACFLLNKWNGRDELVTASIRELLRGSDGRPRRPSRGALRRAFHEIDELTHWPVDDALGDTRASTLPADAVPEVVRTWVREQLASHSARARARRGLSISSALSLWWFPARTLVLHYHVLPDRTYLFQIARRHIEVSVLPVGRVHLSMDMRKAVADEHALRWLAEHTGIGAVAHVPGLRRLVIVPHDAIANVPFAALPVGDRPLCSVVPVTQVDRLARLHRRRQSPRTGPFLSVGRSTYAGAGLPDLPCADREAEAVLAALGSGGSARLDVTRPAVLAELPRAARFHVAAHGVFDTTDPARTGLVLGDGSGGYETLTLRELRRLPLSGLQLATLATCHSAAHTRLPGRERICLPTALLDAGARGVIASLWPVEDDASLEVMTALYERLRTQPPARALADMQAAMHGRRPARQWAGLVFYGNE